MLYHAHKRSHARLGMIIGVGLLLLMLVVGSAAAATLASTESYRLPAGQTIEDNLYVTAEEIVIDGNIDGDLIAFGGYIEVNGKISGDILAMGGGIVVNGPVAGDVRIAGGGLTLNGAIGGDLVSAGGGAAFQGMPAFPIDINGRQIQQGTVLAQAASVGKDALMVGGTGVLRGTIAGSLWASMGTIQLDGAVGGDAHVSGGRITVNESAQIGGTLYYSADNAAAPVIPSGVAASVERVVSERPAAAPAPTLTERFLTWTISVTRALIGLLLLGWLFVKRLPRFTQRVLVVMDSRALVACGVGLLVVLAAAPAIGLIVLSAWLFWGAVAGGLAFALFLFGLLGVLWIVSPVFTGLWLGRRLLSNAGELLAAMVGILVLLLVVRAVEWLPIAGGFAAWLLLLFSFAYAVGAMILALSSEEKATPMVKPTAITQTGPPL